MLNSENDVMKNKIIDLEHDLRICSNTESCDVKDDCSNLGKLVSLSDHMNSCVNPFINVHSNITSTSKQTSTEVVPSCHVTWKRPRHPVLG